MKSSQLLSIVVLVAVSLISADGLSLSLSYPDSSNPSIIRFTCKDGEERAVTATFQKNGEEIPDQLSVIINSGGILEFERTSSQGLGGTFTCTDNGITSNSITLPGAILTIGLSDQTVEGGSTVEFVCAAVASDYQPEIVWMFGSDIYTGCMEGSSYCVESEKLTLTLTRSTFTIDTEEKDSVHLITCYVEEEQTVRDIATLTVEKGSASKEAGIIGGTTVSALVVLITTTVLATVAYWWRQRMIRKKKPSDNGPFLVPADGVPEDGVPEDGVPEDGVPADGIPADGVPADGIPADGAAPADGAVAIAMPPDGIPSAHNPLTDDPSYGNPPSHDPSDDNPSSPADPLC